MPVLRTLMSSDLIAIVQFAGHYSDLVELALHAANFPGFDLHVVAAQCHSWNPPISQLSSGWICHRHLYLN